MVLFRAKPLSRRKFAALVVWAGLVATPSLANPQMLPQSGPWSSGDYVEAIFAVQNGVITLPRQGNPKTEAFFERLIDRGNIETLLAAPLSAKEKRSDILIILSATGEFRGRYGYAVALGDDVQDEFVAIQIFRLYLIDRLASLDIKDEETGCMLESDKRCVSTIATIVSGTIDTLAEKQNFTNDQLIALSSALAQHYPAIRTKLGEGERRRTTERLRGMAALESDPELKSALNVALKAARSGN
jgi:hypothetical protein